jgi:hypothetical protein
VFACIVCQWLLVAGVHVTAVNVCVVWLLCLYLLSCMLHTVDTLVEVDGMIWHAIHGMFSTHFCKHNNMYNVLWCVCVCFTVCGTVWYVVEIAGVICHCGCGLHY